MYSGGKTTGTNQDEKPLKALSATRCLNKFKYYVCFLLSEEIFSVGKLFRGVSAYILRMLVYFKF